MKRAVVALAVLLTACGGSASSDEQQIRELVDRQNRAAADYDVTAMVELTCASRRQEVMSSGERLVPQPDLVDAGRLAADFPTASKTTIDNVLAAAHGNDHDAFRAAWIALLKETRKARIVDIQNLRIDGNIAVADLVIETQKGATQPKRITKSNRFERYNGEWKDCDPHQF